MELDSTMRELAAGFAARANESLWAMNGLSHDPEIKVTMPTTDEDEGTTEVEEEEDYEPLPDTFPTLAELSLHVLLDATTGVQLERHLVKGCSRELFPKLLASTLIQQRPRPLFIRLLLRVRS